MEKKEAAQILHMERSDRIHAINQLLRAYSLYEKDKEYIVQEGKVLIVDEVDDTRTTLEYVIKELKKEISKIPFNNKQILTNKDYEKYYTLKETIQNLQTQITEIKNKTHKNASNVLIIGGAGYIGSTLTDLLLKKK